MKVQRRGGSTVKQERDRFSLCGVRQRVKGIERGVSKGRF